MKREKSTFHNQTRGLLIRTFQWQRRQYCTIFFNLIFPPLLFILLQALRRELNAPPRKSFPFEENPKGGFVARSFRPDECPQANGDEESSKDKFKRCSGDPFVPKNRILVYNPPQFNSILGTRNASKTDGGDEGILGRLSISPYIYPPAIPQKKQEFFEKQSPYDGVFLHSFFSGDEENTLFKIFTAGEDRNVLDLAYKTQTIPTQSKKAFMDNIFDSWLKAGSYFAYSSAYTFDNVTETSDSIKLDSTVFYNESADSNCTEACPVVANVIHLESAIFNQRTGQTATAYLRRMPRIANPDDPGVLLLIVSIIIGFTSHFLFPSFLSQIVYERVSRLRSMMAVMGLGIKQYWFGTYIGLLIYYILSTVFIIIFGIITNTKFYSLNTPISYLILFFLWGNILIALAFAFAPLFTSPESAQTFGWLFLILINIIGGPYIGRRLGDASTNEGTWTGIMLLPSFAYFRSLYYAGALNSGGQGITISPSEYKGVQLGMCSGDAPFCRSYVFLLIEWAILMLIGFYLDRVIPNASGIRLHPLFCFGFKRKVQQVMDSGENADERKGEDVLNEERKANHIIQQQEPFEGVVLDRLTKTYPGNPAVRALRGLSIAAPKNEVLCILAHNGAGKTTAFRTLIGELEATAGTASVFGKSIISDMDSVRRHMGVTPQQDILWDLLTVQEHLFFYGRVKNLSGRALKEAVEQALESVSLKFARRRKVKALSGGMKRRLSVSIALMGNPDFIVLDEPSTGLDILAREKLWNSINKVKQDKVVMLTTHSLEEAEALSTRVAIMSEGELKCIGTAEELKLRLGKGHHLNVSLPESNLAALHMEITKIAPGAVIETQIGGSVEYVLPKGFAVDGIFRLISEKRDQLEIRDWAVNQSSLEDVFLAVTRNARSTVKMSEETNVP